MSTQVSGGTALDCFRRFADAINRHDMAALLAAMTPDHLFVDTLGNRVQGQAIMAQGWQGYFAMCPDYWIRIDQAIAEGEVVLAAGTAGGTIDGTAWQTPAAWKAVVHGECVAQWWVFADNKPVYDILAKRAR
jgi:ketosteroid isomerase-like protein